jgi:hypothetical protein
LKCSSNIDSIHYLGLTNSFDQVPRNIHTQSTLKRPSRKAKKFKFFAIRDAPDGSGINKWRKEKNGLIQITFTPERADMKITCVVSGSETQTISCSASVTDTEFLKMVSELFGNAVVTVMIDKWKPLGKRGAKLVEHGVHDGLT